MHVIDVYFIPGQIVVVLLENITEPAVYPLVPTLLDIHPLLIQLDYLRLALICARSLLFLTLQSNLRVVLDLLVYLLVRECSH